MIKNHLASAIVLSLVSLNCPAARCGECVESEAVYVAALENGPGSRKFDYAVYCLGANPIVEGRLWAGPQAAATFHVLRTDTLRSRITDALTTLLVTSWADSSDNRRLLYRIAARHAIPRLDSADVFVALVESGQRLYFNVYEDMAILQDCRSVDVIRRRYSELRAHPENGYTEEILDTLSCLYHIPCSDAVVAAERLLSEEGDPRLRERLQRVVNRR